MKLLILLLALSVQEGETCRKITGCHKTHARAKIDCPRCEDRKIAENDAACLGCAAKEGICRHCGKSRGRKTAARDPFPTVTAIQKKIHRMKKEKEPSVSVGKLSKSTLENAAELPLDGIGYKVSSPKRKTHFGTDEMVFGLMELGARMHDLYGKEGVFRVGDISSEKGGKLKPHINHQGGRDVDIGLYLMDKDGRPKGNRLVTFDKEGKSKDGTIFFDTARNWEFVVGMIESGHLGKIRAIYLADWLKDLMIEHAKGLLSKEKSPRARERLSKLIGEAERVVSQPKSSPHANHYHLSLSCTAADRKEG